MVASFCSTRRRTLSSISYYYLLAILSLPQSLLNCTSRSLLNYPARLVLSLVRFLYGSSGFPLVGDGSHPLCIHLHYLLWNYTCTHTPCLSWCIPIYVFEPLSSRWSLCVIALIPSYTACVLFIRHYSRDPYSC